MVEAAVVFPVLALFVGLMAFMHGQYREKLSVMTKARADAQYRGFLKQEGVALSCS